MRGHKALKLTFKILMHVFFVLMAAVIVAEPILLGNASAINGFFGIETQIGTASTGSTYYDTKFATMDEVHSASLDMIEETMAEGAVLLKNDDGALPLEKGDRVSLYGAASYYSVHSGQGSSGNESGALSDRVTFFDGLTAAGLDVNSSLNDWYRDNGSGFLRSGSNNSTSATNFMGAQGQETQWVVDDIAWDDIGESSKSDRTDAAVMVIGRTAGEAVDMYMDTTMDDNSTRVIVSKNNNGSVSGSVGDSLELSDNERDVLENLCSLKRQGVIGKIVVIMNSASPLQAAFLEDEELGIDAALWVGTIGTNGATAIGKLLTGEYNPSGRTSDTFWADSAYNPVYYNFGSMQYGNSGILANYFATLSEYNNKFYVVYQEGIYNGYRYTETRYEDYVLGRQNTGEFDYSAAVTYPFGYGLSYTDFSYSNMRVTENADDTYTVTVDVTNNTSVPGKEVVQVYLQKPYTAVDAANGVEKAAVELIGYDKVYVEGNGTVTVSIDVKGKYFASYDSEVEKTYVIGSSDRDDEYLLTVGKDAHDAENNILRYKARNGASFDDGLMTVNEGRGDGDASLVWGKYFAYDAKTYSTNEFIEDENDGFTPSYEGQEANYGVSSITNQFDDVDFRKAGIFSSNEEGQAYMSRNDWTGTYGKSITLTATQALVEAQKNPEVDTDDIAYPTYDEAGFYESETDFDEIKLIYLRGRDYDDPLWDTLLDRMSFDETCALLQDGLRYTNSVTSISAPSTSQQNGALAPVHARNYSELPSQSGFRGFAEELDPGNTGSRPPVFCCNGIVASSFNKDLALRLGEQTGEEAAWAGYNGIYGLGVNIHRGAYGGRTFEYYSEDGYLTGCAAGYETVGMHRMGVFVLAKHAVLNEQETHRAGLNVWANEQSVREVYSRALEVAIEIDSENTATPMLGVMTGMNRMGAKWTGGQGYVNTVLRAEYGMRGFAVSDYNSSRPYMSPVQGVLNGNDLPDGTPAGARSDHTDYDGNDLRFSSYSSGYGELSWAMRQSSKNILYTVVNSNAMNGVGVDSTFTTVTPAWETLLPMFERIAITIFVWCAAIFVAVWIFDEVSESRRLKGLHTLDDDGDVPSPENRENGR